MATTARTPRGPYRGTLERRAEIVRAALEEFASDGYESASLRSVAARVGLSHPGLLHHFATKEELLAAVLDLHEDDERAALSGFTTAATLDDLEAVLVQAVADEQRTPALVRLRTSLGVTAARPDHPAHRFVVRRYARMTDELAGQLDQVAAAGGLAAGVDTRVAGALVLAAVEGLLAHWLVDPTLDVAAALRLQLDRLRPGPPPGTTSTRARSRRPGPPSQEQP